MSGNIFDQQSQRQEPTAFANLPEPKQKSGLGAFVAGTATLAFLAVVVPIYVHVLVKIATWSWNLI